MLLNKRNQSGFTIIELTIVILIAGIMLGMYLKIYSLWRESKDFYTAESNIENAVEAIFAFRSEHGRYPCPADPTLVPGDPNYGEEDCAMATVVGQSTTVVPPPDVYIGMFPLYAIDSSGNEVSMISLISKNKIESSNLSDPWNGNFSYAVSEDLINASNFRAENGSIRIIDESGLDTGGTNGDAHFLIFSRGKDGGCVGRGPTETENCDGDSVFSLALYSTDENLANYYDDIIRFQRSASVGIWTNRLQSGSATEDIYPMNDDPTSGTYGKIHIGAAGYDPAPVIGNLRLDVEGDILSENTIAAPRICDDDTLTDCFQPESLYYLECAGDGNYMTGVIIDGADNLRPVCNDMTFVPAAFSCTPGDYLNGLYSDGSGISCERFVP